MQCCHFDMWIVLSRRQLRPSRLRKSLFTSPWTAYKNYIEGLCQKVLEKEMATYLEKESLGEGNGNPFQYSCLENSMDRGDWWATVRGAAKSWSDWETNTVRESAITRDSFFIRKTYLHGIANICLTIICSSHLLTVPLLFEVPDPYCLLLSVRWYICLNCQTIFESRWGFCKYVIKLNFVLLICLISIQILDQQNIILDEHFPGSYTANPILLICETCLYSSRSS